MPRLAGGRWNPKGTAVVYTAESLSLAALELFVHLDPTELTAAYVAIPVTLPPSLPVHRVYPEELPRDWQTTPAPPELARRSQQWFADGNTAVLHVPSAVVPQESVFLLNPTHPDLAGVHLGPAQPFQFDRRLGKA